MFTGIISDIGTVLDVRRTADDMRARIKTRYDVARIDIGASIASDGVCLTVVATGSTPQNWYEVQISGETLAKTNLCDWHEGKSVNLERPLRVGDELGGHIVLGHVDDTAQVMRIQTEGDSHRITFRAPPALAKFIAPKGSVALNGTSLTVNDVSGDEFGVNIIAHTWDVTTWNAVTQGAKINLEVDMMARYVARLHA